MTTLASTSAITPSHAPTVGTAALAGAVLFFLWGVLHIWVGIEGTNLYLSSGPTGQWAFFTGGSKVPREAFVHATDPTTLFAHSQLLLNFCLDVGGYGLLGVAVAWMIAKNASWAAYFIGLLVIGLGDLTFLFAMVTSGVIEANIPTISGPVLWFLAVIATPFGLPPLFKK